MEILVAAYRNMLQYSLNIKLVVTRNPKANRQHLILLQILLQNIEKWNVRISQVFASFKVEEFIGHLCGHTRLLTITLGMTGLNQQIIYDSCQYDLKEVLVEFTVMPVNKQTVILHQITENSRTQYPYNNHRTHSSCHWTQTRKHLNAITKISSTEHSPT